MTILPPVAGVQAGHSTGGGLLDGIKNAISGGQSAPGQVDAGPKGDGSVGLFDGVLKKALFGGAAGVAMGFIPFIPGGPVLGGIVGALGGAAMGMFGNWMKIKQIKQENEAMLAAMGVQVQEPAIQEVLKTGNVSQLIPMMQSSGATTQTDPVQQQALEQQAALAAQQQAQQQAVAQQQATQQQAIAQGTTPAAVDPALAGIQQSPVPTQGSVAVGSGASGAINPNVAVDPGVAPANLAAQGGGDAVAGAEAVTAENAAIALRIEDLNNQIRILEEMIANMQRRREEDAAAEAAAAEKAAA